MEEIGQFKPRWLPEIEPGQMAIKYQDANGVMREKGGRDLKISQSYPLQPCPQSSTWDPLPTAKILYEGQVQDLYHWFVG